MEKDAEEVQNFLTNPSSVLCEAQNVITHVKVLSTQMPSDSTFGVFVAEQASTLEKSAFKIVKTIEKVIVDPASVQSTAILAFLKKQKELLSDSEELQTKAVKLGSVEGAPMLDQR